MIEEKVDGKTTYLDMENPRDALTLRGGLDSLISEVGQEIDFVLERDRRKVLVEVKSTIANDTSLRPSGRCSVESMWCPE